MIKGTVQAMGHVIECQEGGWYSVTHWQRLIGALAAEAQTYDSLSWAEAMDVVIATAANSRPGWAAGDGWQQPPLFGPGSPND